MNKSRALEIASSPEMAHVTFNEIPIYIQTVDEKNETAMVYTLDEPVLEQEVPLINLIEH
ncbi:H-type small acid-soluble spore protein [Paenibacillus sp. CGMCC 1.16610]|uniref:H-type small acid-soluble spore protein n=1 Tax=Paenibacillus anseongense TaxID=2682845 RepID=A0ABW9UIV1_9BACL|nr:H-type small acid-soluble spore protein [Paenibacillus sp. CGMCC 1.16610]MBA2939577.1 H-type small acid-soluble spore protein [Paenibacillus sp. CGMCC 1.16610]MVQ39239.1 H-type small acid-soluble spore protein [Paenibacillus anseongense]